MLKVREENYNLKAQLHKMQNFLDYAKMDEDKIKTLEERLKDETKNLVDELTKLNLENERLKQQYEFSVNEGFV